MSGLDPLDPNHWVWSGPILGICASARGWTLYEVDVSTHRVRLMEGMTEEAVAARTLLGRLGEGDEIAATVAFLASDDASYITGETIVASGGMMPARL